MSAGAPFLLRILLLYASSCVNINTMDKAIANWIKGSDYDIASAEAMCKTKRYVYVVFFCHLSMEKLLKAVVCKVIKKVPPKTHDLLLLTKLSQLEIPKQRQLLIARLNTVSIPTRYPEDISKLTRQYAAQAAQRYLKETKLFLKWLKQAQKLKI